LPAARGKRSGTGPRSTTGLSIEEGSGTIAGADDQAGASNGATEVVPDGTTYRSNIARAWVEASEQNFFTISGVEGDETDLFTMFVKMEDPRDIEEVKIVFGLDDSDTAPFKENKFIFRFKIKDGVAVNLKDEDSSKYASYDEAVGKSITGVLPQDVTGIRTPNEVKAILEGIGEQPSPKSNHPERNVWGTLAVSRGQFDRIGNDAGRGWNTVRGFAVVTKNVKGKTSTVTFSDAQWVGGGGRTLTGTYKCIIRGVRDTGNYYEMSPPSEETAAINLNHQTLQVTIPGATVNALDPQVDQIWVYLFGGWLDAYYRFAVLPAQTPQAQTIDDLTAPDGSNFDDKDERARITSWGMTLQNTAASSDIVLTLRTSEIDALTANVRLEPYQIAIPDNVVDIAGPWRSRMFVLTTEGYVYPTQATDPSSVNSLHLVDCQRYGDAHWIAKTGNGIYVGCDKDVLFLAGSGDESADFTRIDLYAQPLNVGNAPVDAAHYVDGNTIVYRSADGLMTLSGGSVQPVPDAGTSLLWRGQDRHGVSALNTSTGRFRMTIDNHMFYMLAPEGADTNAQAIYRYSFMKKQWSRLQYNQASAFLNIYTEPDGTILLGDNGGSVWQLETGNTDDGSNIACYLLTPIEDGGQPLAYKDAFDLQLHMDTGGDDATVLLYKDGNAAQTSSYTANTSQPTVWRRDTNNFGNFIKAQMGLTGDFQDFRLNLWDLTYRPRGQRMVYLDTGYFVAGGDFIWVHEIEVDCIAANNFTVKLYFNDVEFDLQGAGSVTATTEKRDVYQIPVPRGAKGERPRIVVQSDTSSGTDVGIDPYFVRVRHSESGNQEGLKYTTVWPAGEAP
jgi:hypothetical protein